MGWERVGGRAGCGRLGEAGQRATAHGEYEAVRALRQWNRRGETHLCSDAFSDCRSFRRRVCGRGPPLSQKCRPFNLGNWSGSAEKAGVVGWLVLESLLTAMFGVGDGNRNAASFRNLMLPSANCGSWAAGRLSCLAGEAGLQTCRLAGNRAAWHSAQFYNNHSEN